MLGQNIPQSFCTPRCGHIPSTTSHANLTEAITTDEETQSLHFLTMDKYILQDHLPKASTEDSSVTILSISGIDNKAYEGPPSVCHQHLHSNTYETEYPIELPGQRSIHGDVEKDGLSGGCRISLDAAPVSKGCQDTLKSQKDLADGQKQLEITCQVRCHSRRFLKC